MVSMNHVILLLIPAIQMIKADLSLLMDWPTEEESTTSDWVRRNKAYKKNARDWSVSHPGPRLVVLKHCMKVKSRLMHSCLHIASNLWDKQQRKQAAKGKDRKFRMVEAALQRDLKEFFIGFMRLLVQPVMGLAPAEETLQNKLLLFRLISRATCSMHCLLRSMRSMYPYSLFLALLTKQYGEEPPCMFDELAVQFRKWFPTFDSEASAALQVLAEGVDLDISAVEARHASSRRIVLSKGLQTWAPTMEHVSADWSLKQIYSRECSNVGAANLQTKQEMEKGHKVPRGGGGGAWRAYVHTQSTGKKLRRDDFKRLSEEYRALGEEERAHYKHLGEQGTLANKHGGHAFGPRVRKRVSAQDGPQVPDFPEEIYTMPNSSMQLVPFTTRNFEKDMKEIRKKFRRLQIALKRQEEEEDMELEQHNKECLMNSPLVFKDLPMGDARGLASSDAVEFAHHQWFPPCSDFAQACLALFCY